MDVCCLIGNSRVASEAVKHSASSHFDLAKAALRKTLNGVPIAMKNSHLFWPGPPIISEAVYRLSEVRVLVSGNYQNTKESELSQNAQCPPPTLRQRDR